MDETVRGADLSPGERRTLASVLDEIIPPSADGRLPGAGELGLAGHLEAVLGRAPELRPVVARGLAALDEFARGRGARGFAELPREARVEALNGLAATEPQCLPSLVFHTYTGYYQQARVLAGLGLAPRPPHPEGHALEAGDPALLEPVRRRGKKLYREC
jgi:hypothetical protein